MKLLKNIGVFILFSFALLLFLELFLRFTGTANRSFTDFEPNLGRGYKANSSFINFNEGFSMGHVNEFGYLGPAYPKEKKSGTFRISLLGDSFVEGFQLFDRDHFRSLCENKLNQSNINLKFEVLNFGRSGFDIANMYALLKGEVNQYNSDLYICFLSNDDIVPANVDPLRPRVFYNDSLVIETEFDKSAIKNFKLNESLAGRSAFLNMAKLAYKKTKRTGLLPILLEKFYPKKDKELVVNKDFSRIPNLTYEIISDLNPANLVFVVRDEIPAYFLDSLDSHGFDYILLEDEFDVRHFSKDDIYYWKNTHQDGHFNHLGHQIISDVLTEMVENRLNETK